MTKLPIFYSSITVLNRENDRDLRVVDGGQSVTFSRGSHLIPALSDEFTAAGRELPIVFVMSEDRPAPVFVVGVDLESNVFVGEDGKWRARYVPAYLRRYPFMLGDLGDQKSVLCIDGGYKAPEEGGERLFDEKGEATAYLNSAIQFVDHYAAAARRTDALIDALKKFDLLHAIVVDVRKGASERRSLQGFHAVSEARLAQLDDASFLELRRSGALPLIYAHLFSLAAFSNLSERSASVADKTAA